MQIAEILHHFGLNEREQLVYLTLARHSWMTVLQLAHQVNIKRTTLYRDLEELEKKGLITKKIDEHTTLYHISDLKNFETLVFEQQQRTRLLQDNILTLFSYLQLLTAATPTQANVKFYRGLKGIQAMTWKINQSAEKNTYILGTNKWHQIVGTKFAEEIRQDRVKSKIQQLEILNTDQDVPIPPSAKVPWSTNIEYVKYCYRHRSIDTQIFTISAEIIINLQSVYLYSLEKDNLIGIEIESPSFANMMRQFFRILWNQARILDNYGGKDL